MAAVQQGKRPDIVKLEIHLIQSVPASRSNTDRQNNPKTIVFGGVKRLRTSSQSKKAATREHSHRFELLQGSERAFRSVILPEKIVEQLEKNNIEHDLAVRLTEKALAVIELSVLNGTKTAFAFLFAEQMFLDLAEVILTNQAAIDAIVIKSGEESEKLKNTAPTKLIGELRAPFLNFTNPEVALYGRFLANLPDGTSDGAVQVMHSFSVHGSYDETDFFSLRDDYLSQQKGAATHIGEHGIGSPTWYHYAAVNLYELQVKLGTEDAAKRVARAFVEAFVMGFPQGAKNSTSPANLPQYILLQRVENGDTYNAAAAFELPVIARGRRSMSACAIEALEQFMARQLQMYELTGRRRVRVSHLTLEEDFAESATNLRTAITRVLEA